MYHKTDHSLNRKIEDLNKIKINLSFKKLLLTVLSYLVMLPVITYLAISTQNVIVLYIYLAPLAPVVFITYAIFTGKLKWLIKLAHKFQAVSSKF